MTTPLLLLVFNRPDHTQKLIEALTLVKPKQIFIVADGPRKQVAGEAERCAEVRKMMNNLPWECSVTTLFREENLGCAQSVGRGISWFFEQVEEGIILEDDCIPHPSFFTFCTELLERYRDDNSVVHIGGCNFQNGKKRGPADYYFSIYNHIWGWATWRKNWQHFEYDINPEGNTEMKAYVRSRTIWNYMQRQFELVMDGTLSSWGFRWTYACWKQRGLSIVPNVNLVKNIGFGEGATHTTSTNTPQASLQLNSIKSPLTHPKKLVLNRWADWFTHRYIFEPISLRSRLGKLKRKVLGQN